MVVLDVGHGNATLIRENSSLLLVDAATRAHVLEYLRRANITAIDVVILSHSDQDHIGGLMSLLSHGIRIGEIRVNADAQKDTEAWRDLIFALEDARRSGEINFSVGITSGIIEVPGFKSCSVEVVAPTPGLAALGVGALSRSGRRITSNSISACIRIVFEGRPVALIPGDLDSVALEDALDAGVEFKSAALIFPHHGGLPGGEVPVEFANRLLAAVSPSLVIISHGRSKHENPRPEIVKAIRGYGAYIACTQLSAHCAKDLPQSSASYVSAIYASGAATRSCCAGTVTVDFSSAEFTMRDAHQAFVESVLTSMCKQ